MNERHTSSERAGAAASQPLVGILTPVYNGQRYLAEGIESVLAQTYANWRHVIVDNRSTDRTVEIAEAYARKDGRISIVRGDEFVPVAANHNRALAHLPQDAEYCKFLHADDWLFPECLSSMVAVAERHPTVGVVGAYRLDGTEVNLDGLPYPSTVVPGREVGRATLLGRLYVFGSPSSIMFRSALIRKHPFEADTFPLHSDASSCLEILQEADFGFVHQVLTYTRRPVEAQRTRSVRLNSYLAEQVVALARYGPAFLTPAEHAQRYRLLRRRYEDFLAEKRLRGADAAFWDYHRQRCASAGVALTSTRLALALLSLAGRVAARPGRPLMRALRVFRATTT